MLLKTFKTLEPGISCALRVCVLCVGLVGHGLKAWPDPVREIEGQITVQLTSSSTTVLQKNSGDGEGLTGRCVGRAASPREQKRASGKVEAAKCQPTGPRAEKAEMWPEG